MYKCVNELNTNLWMLHKFHIFLEICVKCVSNAQYQCVKCTNHEWTNFAWFSLLNHKMLSLWCSQNNHYVRRRGQGIFNCIKCKDDKKIDQNLYVQKRKWWTSS
jgi:hypothetical protein